MPKNPMHHCFRQFSKKNNASNGDSHVFPRSLLTVDSTCLENLLYNVSIFVGVNFDIFKIPSVPIVFLNVSNISQSDYLSFFELSHTSLFAYCWSSSNPSLATSQSVWNAECKWLSFKVLLSIFLLFLLRYNIHSP